MNETWLAHHGIKGQKWGVRRFENPDGSLTEAGRKRYTSTTDVRRKRVNEQKLKESAKEQISNLQQISRRLDRKLARLINEHVKNPEKSLNKQFIQLDSEKKKAFKDFIQEFERTNNCRIGFFQTLPHATCFSFSDGDKTWMVYKGSHFSSVEDITEKQKKDPYPDTSKNYRD